MAILDFFKRRGAGRRRAAPERDTSAYPLFNQVGLGPINQKRAAFKPTPRNLRAFSRTPYARRAINALKNPIKLLDWEIRPVKGIDVNPELQRQIDLLTGCLRNPNNDDSFHSLIEQVIEDICCGAGAIEQRLGGDPIRPLWMWPVDGLSIQLFPAWTGDPNEARYQQTIGYNAAYTAGKSILLRSDELIYLKPNPSTASPFGLGPLEVAFQSISRILGVGEFAGNVASNARPSIAIDIGDSASAETLAAFRNYWRHEVEGQGQMPIFGSQSSGEKGRGYSVLKLFPDGDNALFLKWQEFLKSEIAIAFDLSPQNLGVERDVNRNTAEVGEDRDWVSAIKPMAHMIAAYLTRETVQGLMGFSQLEFAWLGLDREDEMQAANVYATLYASNAITPNEHRALNGMAPSLSPFADMLLIEANAQVAQEAANQAAQQAERANSRALGN